MSYCDNSYRLGFCLDVSTEYGHRKFEKPIPLILDTKENKEYIVFGKVISWNQEIEGVLNDIINHYKEGEREKIKNHLWETLDNLQDLENLLYCDK